MKKQEDPGRTMKRFVSATVLPSISCAHISNGQRTMPIHCPIQPVSGSRDEYHELDYQVMGITFDIHNELGRLCDEKIYQVALARAYRRAGLEVHREVPIKVSHQDFEKIYLADIIVERLVIYEIKTADSIAPAHRRQSLNYVLLGGFRYGKIVNMRTNSVQHEFITTTLSPEERRRFEIDAKEWLDLNQDSIWLRERVTDLLLDWGGFLDVSLYREAINYFRFRQPDAISHVPISSNGSDLGMQRAYLLTPEIGMAFSAITDSESAYEQHLRRFLQHTPLRAIHWMNLNHHRILMKTLTARR